MWILNMVQILPSPDGPGHRREGRNRAGVGHSPWHSLIRTERAGVWGEAERETK